LNADVPSAIDEEQIAAVTSAARILEGAFQRAGLPSGRESSFMLLGRRAPRVARSESVEELAREGISAAIEIADLDCGVLWLERRGVLQFVAGQGPGSEVISALRATQLSELSHLVSKVASSHSTGPIFTRAFGPMGALRDQGFGTVFVAPVKDRSRVSGLLVLGGREASVSHSDVVEAVELLCVLVGVTQARVDPQY
jgi:hypothetical protein